MNNVTQGAVLKNNTHYVKSNYQVKNSHNADKNKCIVTKDKDNSEDKTQKNYSEGKKKTTSRDGKIFSVKTKMEKYNKKRNLSTKKMQENLIAPRTVKKITSAKNEIKSMNIKNYNDNIVENDSEYITIHGEIKSDIKIFENELYIYYDNLDYKNIDYKKYEASSVLTQEDKYDIFYNCLPIRPLKMYGRQLNFYKALQGLKNQKYSIECTCKNTQNPIVKRIEKKSFGVYNNTKNIFKVLFKKSTGKTFVERCAFWPTKTEYYFYQTSMMTGKSYQEQIDNLIIFTKGYGLTSEELNSRMDPKNLIITNKIDLATSKCVNQGNFLFGYNHPCFFFTDPVEFFFLKTLRNHVIACSYAGLKRQTKYTFIYSHPNAMDLSDSVCGFPNISDLARFLEVNFMTYDYSGYGISSGKPSEEILKDNLRTVIDHVIKKRKVSTDKIVLFGYSIGASLSAIIATEYPNLAGLILFGAPASLSTVVKYQLFKSNINIDDDVCGDAFNTVKAISNANVPTLIVHSRVDKMVPHSNGFAIYKNAKNPLPPYLLPDIKHNYMDTSSQALLKVKEFIQYTLKQDPLK